MTRRELREMIRSVIKEYTGTGSSGGNTDSINKSPRPYVDAEDEIEAYTDKGAPYGGAEGGHYKREKDYNYEVPGAQSSGGPRF